MGMARLQVEGLTVDPEAPIASGDLYLARRNSDWQLLTCLRVEAGPSSTSAYVVPRENGAYPFDLRECAKVVAA
jgi:hypothetical protein